MDNTTLLVMETAQLLYLDDKARRVHFGQDTGLVVTFDSVTPQNTQYVHEACHKLGINPAEFSNSGSSSSSKWKDLAYVPSTISDARRREILSASSFGRDILAKEAEEDRAAAAELKKYERPTDKYLKMTSQGQDALTYRKKGKS
jgi:hypothetical protein